MRLFYDHFVYLLWIALLVGLRITSLRAERIVVNEGQAEPIRLSATTDLYPGDVLDFRLTIPQPKLSLVGSAPPKLRRIYSLNSTGIYAVGDELYIAFEFYTAVNVVGTPAVELNTGCIINKYLSSSSQNDCIVREIQQFTCSAERGAFSLKLGEQVITNIYTNTTSLSLKRRLEALQGIINVEVKISSNSSNAYDFNKVCSKAGNTVSIVFKRVFFPLTNGDVPTLFLDAENDFLDERTSLSTGSNALFLSNLNTSQSIGLEKAAVEVVKGQNQSNAFAFYISGNNTDTLIFKYTVGFKDSAQRLDVVSFDFTSGSIWSNKGEQLTDIFVPEFGNSMRYLQSLPSSLSYNQQLTILATAAKVSSISSLNSSGLYTAGDDLIITVHYNVKVLVDDFSSLTLQLATGVFTRGMPCIQVLNNQQEGTTLLFLYSVQPQDTSLALDVTSSAALTLHSASIYRLSSYNTKILAEILLPDPGQVNSLSFNRQLVINTQSPFVISVQPPPSPSLPKIAFTAGDLLNITILFNTKVTVYNKPRIRIKNTPAQYDSIYIRTLPLTFSTSNISSMQVNSNRTLMLLSSTHPFTKDDIDSEIILRNYIYTIRNVYEDVVELYEEYIGPKILLSNPPTTISTPPYRYAYYLEGNNTDKLIFQYKVNRLDYSSSNISLDRGINSVVNLYKNISINANDSINTNEYLIDLFNGSLYRYSQHPVVPASLLLPPMQSNNYSIDTEAYYVVSIYTTTPHSTVLRAGDVLDIWLQFNGEVVLVSSENQHITIDDRNNTIKGPRLLFNSRYSNANNNLIASANNSYIEYADYVLGSGSKELLFVYVVKEYDFINTIYLPDILKESLFLQQPLRIINGNQEVYLKNKAFLPYIQANLSLSNAFQSNFDNLLLNRVQLQGKAAYIVQSYVYYDTVTNVNYDNMVYSAGDMIYLAVEFDQPIELRYMDNYSIVNSTQHLQYETLSELTIIKLPYLLLEVGNTKPGVAFYHSMLNKDHNSTSNIMLFQYKVQVNDSIHSNTSTNALKLTCTCSDYFQRIYLQLPTVNMTLQDIYTKYYSELYSLSAHVADHSLLYAANDNDYIYGIYSNYGTSRTTTEVSLLMPANEPYSLANWTIDNSIPYVVDVFLNISKYSKVNPAYQVSHTVYSSLNVGDVVLIGVEYSTAVVVYGNIYAELVGSDSIVNNAYYYSGNNTNTLHFLYFIDGKSNRARLEFKDRVVVNIDYGRVFRKSSDPILLANNAYVTPESRQSISRRYKVYVNTQPPAAQSIQYIGKYNYIIGESNVKFLSAKVLTYNAITVSDQLSRHDTILSQVEHRCPCSVLRMDELSERHSTFGSFVYNSTNLVFYVSDYNLSSLHNDDINNSSIMVGYQTYTLYNKDDYLSNIVKGDDAANDTISGCLNWWQSYEINDKIVVQVEYDQKVRIIPTLDEAADKYMNITQNYIPVEGGNARKGIYDNIFISMNDYKLSRAFATDYQYFYLLYIQKPNSSTYYSNDQYFVLYYDGLYSSCLALTSNEDELHQALLSFPELNRLSPRIIRYPASESSIVNRDLNYTYYNIFRITFTYLPTNKLQVITKQSQGRFNSGFCSNALVESDMVVYMEDKYNTVNFIYNIASDHSLLFEVKEEVLAKGNYSFTMVNMPMYKSMLLEQGSVVIRQFNVREKQIGRIVSANNKVVNVLYSNLYFTKKSNDSKLEPGAAIDGIDIDVCFNQPMAGTLELNVLLPGFNISNKHDIDITEDYHQLHYSNFYKALSRVVFRSNSSTLHIISNDDELGVDQCFHLRHKASLSSNSSISLIVPPYVLYQSKSVDNMGNSTGGKFSSDENSSSSRLFKSIVQSDTYFADNSKSVVQFSMSYRYHNEQIVIEKQYFDSSPSILFDYFKVEFSDSRPYFPTNLTLSFRLSSDSVRRGVNPCLDCILVYIPNLYIANVNNESVANKYDYDRYLTRINNKYNVTVTVLNSDDFSATWSNVTNTLSLSVNHTLLLGYDYSISITSHVLSHFIVPQQGFSPCYGEFGMNDAPSVAMDSNTDSIHTDFTVVSNYPLIYGYDRENTFITLTIDNNLSTINSHLPSTYVARMIRNEDSMTNINKLKGTYVVTNIGIQLALASDLKRPALLTFYIPNVMNVYQNTLKGSMTLLNNGNALNAIYSYIAFNRSLTIICNSDIVQGVLLVSLTNLTNFILDNSNGITKYNSIQSSDATSSINDLYTRRYINESLYVNSLYSYFSVEGRNGKLNPSPIFYRDTPYTPLILYSKLSFSNLDNDLFYAGYDTMQLTILLNMPVSNLQDTFTVSIEEGVVVDLAHSYVVSDNCYAIVYNEVSLSSSVFTIGLTNFTHCVFKYPLSYTINITIGNVVVNANSVRFIRQYNKHHYASIQYQNTHLATNSLPVTELSALGLYGSRITLSTPLANTVSPFSFSMLLSTSLSKSDQIILYLPAVSLVPISFVGFYIYDQYYRIWYVDYNSAANCLLFTVPIDLLALSALRFDYNLTSSIPFSNNIVNKLENINLQNEDIANSIVVNNSKLAFTISQSGLGNDDIVKIGLRKYISVGQYIDTVEQPVTHVTPVAALHSTLVYLSRLVNSFLYVTIEINFYALYILQYNDQIVVEVPYLTCRSTPSLLTSSTESEGYFEAYCSDSHSINIRILQSPVSRNYTNRIAFEISPSHDLTINSEILCALGNNIDNGTSNHTVISNSTAVGSYCGVTTNLYSAVTIISNHVTPAVNIGIMATDNLKLILTTFYDYVNSLNSALLDNNNGNAYMQCLRNTTEVIVLHFTLLQPLVKNSSIVFTNLQNALLSNSVEYATMFDLDGNSSAFGSFDYSLNKEIAEGNLFLTITIHSDYLLAGEYELSFAVCYNRTGSIIDFLPTVYDGTNKKIGYKIRTNDYSHHDLLYSDEGHVIIENNLGLRFAELFYVPHSSPFSSIYCPSSITLTEDKIIGGSLVSAQINVAAAQGFFPKHSKLTIHLPGFELYNHTLLHCFEGSSTFHFDWQAEGRYLTVTFLQPTENDLTFSAGYFITPPGGSNSYVNLPTISYNTSLVRNASTAVSSVYYPPTSFALFQNIVPFSYLSLEFTYPFPSHPSPLLLSFRSNYSFIMLKNDYVDIYIPRLRYYSTNVDNIIETIILGSNNSNSNMSAAAFNAILYSNDSILRLTAVEDIVVYNSPTSGNRTAILQLALESFVVPAQGLDVHIVQSMFARTSSPFLSDYTCPYLSPASISSTNILRYFKNSDSASCRGSNLFVKRIGYFEAPSLLYMEDDKVLVSLKYSESITTGDVIGLSFGNFILDNSTCLINIESTWAFNYALTSKSNTLSLQISNEIPANTLITINVSHCIHLNPVYYASNTGKASRDILTVTHNTNADKFESGTELALFNTKALEMTVKYTIHSNNEPIGIQIILNLYAEVKVKDIISIYAPVLTLRENTSDPSIVLTILGDLLSNDRRSPFKSSFNIVTRRIELECIEEVRARLIYITINENNKLQIDYNSLENDDNMQHYVSYNLSSYGSQIVDQAVSHSPLLLPSLYNANVLIKKCTASNPAVQSSNSLESFGSTPTLCYCDVALEIMLAKDMKRGEMISIGHESFYYDSNTLISMTSNFFYVDDAANADTLLYGSNNITIYSEDANRFNISYRPRDDIYRGSLSSNIIYDDAVTDSSMPYKHRITSHSLSGYSSTVADSFLLDAKQFNSFSVVQDLPSVVEVYLRENTHVPILCGQSIYIVIVFSKPIYINIESMNSIKVMLNTHELANYYTHTQNTLTMLYTPMHARNVSSLAVLGSNALELYSSGLIKDGISSKLYDVNLTIPQLYTRSIYVKGRLHKISLDLGVDCISNQLAIVNTIVMENSLSHSNIYSAGDYLDITYEYDYPIQVMGTPFIVLNNNAVAYYRNVSRTQYIRVYSSGSFSLQYQNASSVCVTLSIEQNRRGSNIASIYNALYSIFALRSSSFPISVTKQSTTVKDNYELVYLIEFKGVIAPDILSINNRFQRCDVNDLRADVKVLLGNISYKQVSFRYEVTKIKLEVDADRYILSYDGNYTDIITDSNNYLYCSMLYSTYNRSAVSLTLPVSNSIYSLYSQGIVIDNSRPYITALDIHLFDAYNNEIEYSVSIDRNAVSGDYLVFRLEFSYPITILFNSSSKSSKESDSLRSLFLPLYINNMYDLYDYSNDINSSLSYQKALFSGYEYNVVTFLYEIKQGDRYRASANGSVLIGDAMYFNAFNDTVVKADQHIYKLSYEPSINANVMINSSMRTTSSSIIIDAVEIPVISRVYTITEGRNLTAGNTVQIFLEFSSAVEFRYDDLNNTLTPYVNLTSPSLSILTYERQVNSTTLSFLFSVPPYSNSSYVSFTNFSLHRGLIIDAYTGQSFSSFNSHPYYSIYSAYRVSGLTLDTDTPRVLRVDCGCEDSTYYPGQSLDILVVYSKAVQINFPVNDVAANSRSIALELFLPSVGTWNKAFYTSGNLTNILHFSFTIPSPNPFELQQSFIPLDYNGIASLLLNLEGFSISDISPNPLTISDSSFPTLDRSYLFFNRKIYIYLKHAEFTNIALLPQYPLNTRTGNDKDQYVFTYGDIVYLGVSYSTPVMVFRPAPFLLLRTSLNYNSTAKYIAGNNTKMLVFEYKVQEKDSTDLLDIVNTFNAPYFTSDPLYSYPIIAYDDFNRQQFQSKFSAVYASSNDIVLPIVTVMPVNSLSANAKVVLDTSPPYVIGVSVLASNGSFNSLVTLVVTVQFSSKVVMKGCPRVLFILNNKERFAYYYRGNLTNILYFSFTISSNDKVTDFDYYSLSSFKLLPCNILNVKEEIYIRRYALVPRLNANLTMPRVNSVISLLSPRSILGNNQRVGLTNSLAFVDSISLPGYSGTNSGNSSDNRNILLALGDLLDISVHFTSPVAIQDIHSSISLVYLTEEDILNNLCTLSTVDQIEDYTLMQSRIHYGNAYYTVQSSAQSISYTNIIAAQYFHYDQVYITLYKKMQQTYQLPSLSGVSSYFDKEVIVSYGGVYAYSTPTSSCGIQAIKSNTSTQSDCAAQNLPFLSSPYCSNGRGNNRDLLTKTQVKVKSSFTVSVVTSFHFPKSIYEIGEKIEAVVTLSEEVIVQGRPKMILSYYNALANQESIIEAYYTAERSNTTSLVFTLVVSPNLVDSFISCNELCYIDLYDNSNGYVENQIVDSVINVYRKANFLPLLLADLDLSHLRSTDYDDTFIWTVLTIAPYARITKVYSNNSDVLIQGEVLYIFVEFSVDVRVYGEAFLVLDIYNSNRGKAIASYYSQQASTTLLFTYIVQDGDYSSAVDYLGSNSLYFNDDILSGLVRNSITGIYLNEDSIDVPVSLNLPPRGSLFSLAIQSPVVIDQQRPRLLSLYSTKRLLSSSSFSCGDLLTVALGYDKELVIQSSSIANFKENIKLPFSILPLNHLGSHQLPLQRTLNFVGLDRNNTELIFHYLLTSLDPPGSVVLGNNINIDVNKNPIQDDDIHILSRLTNLPISYALTKSLSNISIDNKVPYVTKVYSYNSTIYTRPFTLGDELLLYVEFSSPINIYPNDRDYISLDLQFNNGIYRQAKYLTYHENVLLLYYTIQQNDMADRLEYSSAIALSGTIYAVSSCDIPILVNSQLPAPYTAESLYKYDIIVDSTSPYINFLMPLKYPGSYGENEEIYILARFNRPVLLQGVPQLALKVNSLQGNKSIGIANSTNVFPYEDTMSITLGETDILFYYVVQYGDDVSDLTHYDSQSIRTGVSGAIFIKSASPIYSANTLLRDPSDFDLVEADLVQQWKYRFAHKIDLLMRDIYVANLNSIGLELFHNGDRSLLLNKYTHNNHFQNNKTIANQFNAYLKDIVQSTIRLNNDKDSNDNEGNSYAVGEDLTFADNEAENIARFALATQSSTIQSAHYAIDGKYNNLVNYQSLSETSAEDYAWFLLKLKKASSVQSVVIYERLPEQWSESAIDVTIKAVGQPPRGYFKLQISNIVSSDSNLGSLVNSTALEVNSVMTDYLPIECSSDDMQRAIEDTRYVGNVQVYKRVLPYCAADGTGCGEKYEHGYGSTYQIVFVSLRVAFPDVQVVSIKYPGQPLEDQVDPNIPQDGGAQGFTIVTKVEKVREGKYVEVKKQYFTTQQSDNNNPKNDISNKVYLNTTDDSLSNPWLTPFYLMLFSYPTCSSFTIDCRSSPPSLLNDSIAESVWFARLTQIDLSLIVNLPKVYENITHIKIQRESFGSLSLAELEVFSTRLNTLQDYYLGSPVQSNNPLLPYQATTPFYSVFNNDVYDGLWYLKVTVDSNITSNHRVGNLGDIVIIITDYAGILHVFYQDITSSISTLPRFGSIFTSYSATALQYVQYPEVISLRWKQLVVTDLERTRVLGLCKQDNNAISISSVVSSEDFAAQCLDSFYVAPQLIPQSIGDVPYESLQRNQRIIYYLPNPGFVGEDSFTFIVNHMPRLQQASQTVSLTVQKCQQYVDPVSDVYLQAVSNPLCRCVSSPDKLIGNPSACQIGINTLCSDSMLNSSFFSLCSACSIVSSGEVFNADNCRLLTLRAVALLQVRRLCGQQYTTSYKNTLSNIDYILYISKYADQANANTVGFNITAPVCLKKNGVSKFSANNLNEFNTKVPVEVKRYSQFIPYQTLYTNQISRR